MKPTTRAARRGLAALALAGAAVGIPTAALATSASPAKPGLAARTNGGRRPEMRHRRADRLARHPGMATPGAPTTSRSCPTPRPTPARCTATPGSPPWAPAGISSGSAAGRGPASANRLVTLSRGATAHVELQITDVANFPPSSCGPTPAVALRVYPPGATRSLQVPFTFQACGKTGPVYLHVGTTVGGTGIPGFSG